MVEVRGFPDDAAWNPRVQRDSELADDTVLKLRVPTVHMRLIVGYLFAALALTPRHVAVDSASREILVVVSSINPIETLDLPHLRRIFLREQTVWPNGWPITVFERSSEEALRSDFTSALFGKTPEQLTDYWLNLSMTRGIDPPKVCRTVAMLKQYFDRMKGAIGYLSEGELAPSMKVVARVTPRTHR